MNKEGAEKEELTADGLARLEDLGDFWIHIDHHVLFGLDLVVALPHLRLHPLGEWVANDGIDDIGDVLPRKLLHLPFDGKITSHLRICTGKGLHILNRQALELWHIDVLSLVALDPLLSS